MAMYLDEVDLIGKLIPLRFAIGDDIVIPLEFRDEDDVAIDVTSRTYTLTIFSWDGTTETEIVAFTVDMSDAVNGNVSISNTATTSGVAASDSYQWKCYETSSNTLLWKGPVTAQIANA